MRLFRLWKVHAYLDYLWMTRSLKQFVMWYLADGILSLAAVTGMLLLAERFAGIGQWTKYQVIFMLGYASTVSGIVAVFFSYNVVFISRRLGRGQLDHSLIQPQPLWMTLLTEGFTPFASSGILLPGVGLMVWAVRHLPRMISPGWLALLMFSLLASSVVLVAFQFFWGSLAFWAPRAAEEISSSTMALMDQLKSFPLDGLGAALSGSMMTFLPVGFLAWHPCRALLGLTTHHSPLTMFLTPLAALAFSLIAVWMFRQGLQHYGRTGSQRYSDFGHRS